MRVFTLPSANLWDKSSHRQFQNVTREPTRQLHVALPTQPGLTFGQDSYVSRKKHHHSDSKIETSTFDVANRNANDIYDRKYRNTWLHQAVLLQNEGAAATLASQDDADLSIENKNGLTAFTLCALVGDVRIARLLRSKGARLQSWRKDGDILYPSDLAREKQKKLDKNDPRYRQFRQVIEFFQREEKPSREFACLLSGLSD